MGLFSGGGIGGAIVGGVGGFITGGVGGAISGAAQGLAGAAANAGTAQAAKISKEQRKKALEALKTGNIEARGYLTPQLEAGKEVFTTGAEAMKTVAARDPYVLTPQQKLELSDRARTTIRGINPGLRGSGRFTTAAINDVVNKGRAGMITQNQARSDDASKTMFGTGANMTQQTSGNLANLASGEGKDIANVERDFGVTQGNAAVSTGAVNASTIGAIGSVFADALKNDRGGRYDEYRATSA